MRALFVSLSLGAGCLLSASAHAQILNYSCSSTEGCFIGTNSYNGATSAGVYGSGSNAGVYGTSSAIGVYGTSSSNKGVYGIGPTDGVFGESDSSSGTGVQGYFNGSGSGTGVGGFAGEGGGNAIAAQADNGRGVDAISLGGGDAIHGEVDSTTYSGATGINNGAGNGVYGASTGGVGVYGSSPSGEGIWGTGEIGVYGAGTTAGAVATSSGLFGVDATCSGTNCDGVYAGCTGSGCVGLYATSSSTQAIYAYNNVNYPAIYAHGGDSDGVQAQSDRNVGAGLYAWNTSGAGYGVYGRIYTSGSIGGTGTAVEGDNPNSSGWSGVFTGRVSVATGLQVNGTCIAGTCTSDRRLKRDIEPMKNSLELLSQLKPVTFYWKNPEKDPAARNTSKMQRGFIAQDVETVMPDWVSTNDQGYKTIDTAGIVPMLVDSVKTLKQQNDDLRGELDSMKRDRRVVVAGNAWGFAIGGLALGLGLVVTQWKKKDEDDTKKHEKK